MHVFIYFGLKKIIRTYDTLDKQAKAHNLSAPTTVLSHSCQFPGNDTVRPDQRQSLVGPALEITDRSRSRCRWLTAGDGTSWTGSRDLGSVSTSRRSPARSGLRLNAHSYTLPYTSNIRDPQKPWADPTRCQCLAIAVFNESAFTVQVEHK